MKKELKINALITFFQVILAVLMVGVPKASDLGLLTLVIVPATLFFAAIVVLSPFSKLKGTISRVSYALVTSAFYILFAYLCYTAYVSINTNLDFALKLMVPIALLLWLHIWRSKNLYQQVSFFNNGSHYPLAYVLCTIPFGIGLIIGVVLTLLTCNTEVDL